MPLEIRGAYFLIRSTQLVRGTRLEWALFLTEISNSNVNRNRFAYIHVVNVIHDVSPMSRLTN